MNFFKSVFSGDPDPTDSSSEGKSPSDSPRKPRENEKGEGLLAASEDDSLSSIYHTNTKPSIPWAGIGSLIKNFASKSESVIQTYRRDLEEFSSGLKKETEAIREVASRAVRDLPYSLEAGASAAQESLESVGQAIDDFGGSVWRGTAEIISEGKDALLAVDSDVDAYSSDPQIPSSTSIPASASKRYSRFEAQLLALQSDPNTFSEEPEDDEDFCKWKVEFMLEEKEEEIELLCYDNGILEGLFEKLVPSVMDYNTFWIRYFYKLHKLKLAEDARANLVKRVISREDEDENLTWEVDDDEEEWKDEEKVDEKEDDKGKESKGMEISGSEDEVKVVSKEESKSEHVEEGKENAKENKEANKCDYVEVSKEKGSNNEIELEHEKSPGVALEDMSSVVTTIANDEAVVPSIEEVDDTKSANNDLASGSGDKAESANNHLATESNEKVPKSPSELLESLEDINISVVEIQNSMPEEEDLGWDEIEDLSEHDKNVGVSSSTVNRKDLHERANVAEDDDDLTWDIEDDD